MTKEQKSCFQKLADKRKTFAKLSQDSDYKGMWEVLIKGIYSEDAHFIYELLQNAEDVKATSVKFVLKDDGLYFVHNGITLFTITDIENKDENGHINAITAVGRTGKKISETIGKFGIGFKAVFQYTKSPQIFDPNFQFKIDDYIVPQLLENINIEIPYNKEKDTVFYFPFITESEQIDNNKVKSRDEAYKDISEKLKNLDKPTLFLSNLKEVIWEIGTESSFYKKEITATETKENIKYDRIKLSPDNSEFYMFTRFHEEHINGINLSYNYSVGFEIKEERLKRVENSKAYCFFTTKHTTNLNFLFHAPFLLNSNRERVPEKQNLKIKDNDTNREQTVKENFNEFLINQLAQLAADSLLILKDLRLIDDDIIHIIPYKKPAEDDLFAPFYTAIKQKFATEALIPAKDGTFARKENAYWAQDKPVLNLFSEEQLGNLIKEENAKWVFVNFVRNQTGKDEELRDYIDGSTKKYCDMDNILFHIDATFIENQSNEWLHQFYNYLSKNSTYWDKLKKENIFLNRERKAVSSLDKQNRYDKSVLFLPDNDGDGYETLNADLFGKTKELLEGNTELAKKFYEKFDVREHTVADEIKETIVRFQKDELADELFFAKAFKYFKNQSQDTIDAFIEKIERLPFIPYKNNDEGFGVSWGADLHYPTEKLLQFYAQKPATKFVDIEKLQKEYDKTDHKSLDSFLKKLGVVDKDPDLKDEVFNIILPQYNDANKKQKTAEEVIKHFETFFEYYKKCPNDEIQSFIDKLKPLCFLVYRTAENRDDLSKAIDLYYPSDDLKKYFETKPDTKFLDLEIYDRFIKNEIEQVSLKEFLLQLGVSELPRVTASITENEQNKEFINDNYNDIKIRNRRSGFITRLAHKHLDGLEEILVNIDNDKSLILWKFILQFGADYSAKFEYAVDSYNTKTKIISSDFIRQLKSSKWLYCKDNKLVAPNEITVEELGEGYESDADLERILGFKPTTISRERQITDLFGSVARAEAAIKALEEKEARGNRRNERNNSAADKSYNTDDYDDAIESLNNISKTKQPKEKTNTLPNFDEDEAFAKGIEDLKKQLEIKKSRLDLVENINNSQKYAYDWFEAYLELLATYGEKQDVAKQKSISFQSIKPHKDKFFLLSGASSYISPEIENANDFKVSLVFGRGRKENITVEGVSKKGQDLLIYCPESLSENMLSRLSNVFKVEINFTPVIDLLERLKKAFENRNNMDTWENIKDALPPLKYIYGPPGTGKTTTLCNNITEILDKNPDAKFLVLTPTNKAADVVCKKLIEINADILTVRLSHATDPELEESGIYRNTPERKDMESIQVVASTIHRLPYFDIKNVDLLFQYAWDYVVFDEASMTGLHYITFALMALSRTNPKAEFIIAGDPKQIPPVVDISDSELETFDFQDENIYKMMGLESFNPAEQIVRPIDSIQNLDTQYRSIPEIGQLFSELSYSNLLKHDRATNRKEAKALPEAFRKLIGSNVTFIDIPLDRDTSIYKVNKLFYSSYHTYCAILVAEIIKYFDVENKKEKGKDWTIGLIAPYKAQAILLNKLITSYGISENIKVYADTVHGFQGDECDIVFFICNPNNYFYSGHEKCLLSKEYIYNVAISRAKDYLVILHPFTVIQDNKFINQIGGSFRNNFGNAKIIDAHDIEEILFDDARYIENNSYVSGHDNVNIFGLSEMKYFIKANDTAIDIQLRDLKKISSSII